MFEETVSVLSIWGYMVSWLTPTVLFVVLNVMIGTIAVTSGFGSSNQYNKPHHPTHTQDPTEQHQQSPILPELSRSPSLLQSLESSNLNSLDSQQLNPSVLTTAALATNPVQPSDPVEKIDPDLDAHLEDFLAPEIENRNGEVHEADQSGGGFEPGAEAVVGGEDRAMDQIYGKFQMSRSKSEKRPSGGIQVEKLQVKKSASDVSVVKPFAPEEKEKEEEEDQGIVRVERPVIPVDEEVDAKADDFINKFKQQLKSQTL